MAFADKEATTGRLVLVRHGQSKFNEENRFAGWVNTPLTQLGVNQAQEAGQQLKQIGFKPDTVISTVFSRALDTAKNILSVLGVTNKQIEQSSAMMERHYGGLTGMDKDEAKAKYGDEQFLAFRRSFNTRPPVMDKDHPYHPDNSSDKPKVIGMPDNGLGTESLEDVVNRVKPYWEKELLPRLQKGENIMIAAHGNSLRALTMIIKNMSKEEIQTYEMANAKPYVYDITSAKNSTKWDCKEVDIAKAASARGA